MTRAEMLNRITELENARFMLDMKDNWSNDDFAANSKLTAEVEVLKELAYEKVAVTKIGTHYSATEVENMETELANRKANPNPSIMSKVRMDELESKLASNTYTYTGYTYCEPAIAEIA